MRNLNVINEIIVHCSDTRIDQNFDISDIRSWHKQRGWSDVGYHYYIKLDGTVQYGRPIDVKGAHVKGRNYRSIGICFEGGKKEDGSMWERPNYNQVESFRKLKNSINNALGRELEVNGHRKYSSIKTCPNFDVDIL